MVATWFKQRREFRDRVAAEVERLQAEHGHAAYVMAATAARSPLGDWRFAEAVRDGLRLEAIAADIAGDGHVALELLDINSYDIAVLDRDIPGPSGDDIARAMSELAAASSAPPSMSIGLGSTIGLRPGAGTPGAAPAAVGTATAVAEESGLVRITDQELCTDCGTCYQELPQLFEKTKKVINGEARIVAQLIPGAAEKIEVTPELEKRIERVKATCDAEIIR